MKPVFGAVWLLLIMLCSCSTTPKPVGDSAQGTQAIYEQANFVFPLSFSEHLPMSGHDFADTIESYTSALRKINLASTSPAFRAAYQNYLQAWDKARALAAQRPNDTFVRARNGQTVVVEGPQAGAQSNPSATLLYQTSEAYSADFQGIDREIERWSKRLKALAGKQ